MADSELRVTGKLIEYFETGCEGIYWALQEDGKHGYDGLVLLDEGDHLQIIGPDGETVFEGTVRPRKDINAQKRPYSEILQPVSMGRWVHWIQADFDADTWGNYFISRQYTGVVSKLPENL
ncbi:hypothetical protein G8764_21595 [Pseudomaricurvus alcaniphilus]|uniref:hypothetical protein n=1 Tax=Pseudomaricurvus alcaniphilus TaxID=1166482 RepID=UPI00140902D6|nr:hypothetical protein [Pseudomaricurvus alcaniphilus]NHN39901.1 hypothetical protein [Pseudomaricurvus alcaniphilus]